jgi:hypothetical protein
MGADATNMEANIIESDIHFDVVKQSATEAMEYARIKGVP